MCFTSFVSDQYRPFVPSPLTITDTTKFVVGPSKIELSPEQMQQLIDSFKEAFAAAQVFDSLTGQPDCVDPEKAKLFERVEALEKQLAELKSR